MRYGGKGELIAGLLIASGVDVNAKTKRGESVLSCAKWGKGNEVVVELLRKHGAKE